LEFDNYYYIAKGYSVTFDYYYAYPWDGVGVYTYLDTPIHNEWHDEVRYNREIAEVVFDRGVGDGTNPGIIYDTWYWGDGFGTYWLSAVHVYDNEDAGYSCASVLVPLDLPTGEIASWDRWCEGEAAGAGCWTQTLTPIGNTLWAGMAVSEREADGYTPVNTCGVGSVGLTGLWEEIGPGGSWKWDAVGFTYQGVADIRQLQSAPCYWVAAQQMRIDVNLNDEWQDYGGVNYLYSYVAAGAGGQVTSQKNSESHSRNQ
jgi:hypothetical protein